MERTTERDSYYSDLERMPVSEILKNINKEDHTVPVAVERAIPQLEKLVTVTAEKMKVGGRLFYIGAGTSGRLGIVDASECPPTFGVDFDRVVGIIAGGDGAIRRAVEFAEDDTEQAWKDLSEYHINDGDVLVGIAASGTTPYVIGGLQTANQNNVITGCIVCNTGSPVAAEARNTEAYARPLKYICRLNDVRSRLLSGSDVSRTCGMQMIYKFEEIKKSLPFRGRLEGAG